MRCMAASPTLRKSRRPRSACLERRHSVVQSSGAAEPLTPAAAFVALRLRASFRRERRSLPRNDDAFAQGEEIFVGPELRVGRLKKLARGIAMRRCGAGAGEGAAPPLGPRTRQPEEGVESA